MQKRHKDLLRTLVRELRHKLVGSISPIDGQVERGNLDRELERLGIAPDGTIKPIDTLIHTQSHEHYAHRVAAAQLAPLSLSQRPAVRTEIIERAAYTWMNRLLALRAMEVRDLIDNTLRGNEVYGGIPEKLFLVRDTQAERAIGADGGWWAVVEDACNEQAQSLPGLFALNDPIAALRPSEGVLLQCVTLIGGNLPGFTVEEADGAFKDPDAIGWAYQFYQEESKTLIYAKLGNGGKATSRAEIAAATQLFTEPYMVQWLLQNSLGRSYHEINPHSALPQTWPYYVKPEKLDTSTHFTLATLTMLDPCAGSGHFLRAAFDMFVGMYREQSPAKNAREIADCILTKHLFGIDLDPRAAQLTALTLYLRAWELVRDERQQQYLPGGSYKPSMNIATTPTNLDKGALERHLQRHPQDSLFEPLIKEIFAGLEQAEILGSLLRPREYLDNAITTLQKQHGTQRSLFDPEMDELRIKIAELATSDPKGLKQMALQRVTESFQSEAGNVDDVSAMLFGREAGEGVHLMQLLDQQYAVVATNPPYMGSKNMDIPLKKYVEKHYSSGRRDLYAVFILRCLELCKPDGRVAMVTMQSWLFLRSFAELRAVDEVKSVKSKSKGLLHETSIEALAHLGRYAFSELGNAVIAPVLFTIKISKTTYQHRLWACRLTAPRPSEEQSSLLKKSSEGTITEVLYYPQQREFLKLDGTPIIYWVQDKFIKLLGTPTHYKDNAVVLEGLHIPYNTIYLRFVWEVPSLTRWVPFFKGGGYAKWVGFDNYCVEWEHNGRRIKQWPKAIIPSEHRYFQSGLTYGLMALGSLSARLMENGIFSAAGFAVFNNPKHHYFAHAAYLNSHLCSYLLRCLNPSLRFNKGVAHIPQF